jgi:hypothetical protein
VPLDNFDLVSNGKEWTFPKSTQLTFFIALVFGLKQKHSPDIPQHEALQLEFIYAGTLPFDTHCAE